MAISGNHSGSSVTDWLSNLLATWFGRDSYHELSQQIKEIEKRMAEIAELKKQIINYAKTKEVYSAYRQSGFSAKYYEANTENILLHQSAKQVLELANPEKILTFKSLQLEYQTYQLRKKFILANYKIEKLQMRKFLNTKNNLDYILNIGEAKKARNDRSILNIGDDSLIN